jgi:16S rRNA (guanine966-N2)-methyltransferase
VFYGKRGDKVRIIAGKYRSARIHSPGGRNVRPTSDRVREAIFSILGEDVVGVSVLDLFAGSGAMGLEALSRGANKAIFVEKSRKAASIIFRNIKDLGIEKKAFEVVICDSLDYLKKAFRKGNRYGLVFIDPPYESSLGNEALDFFDHSPLLEEGGMLVCEFKRGRALTIPNGISVFKEKVYGDSSVTFCRIREGSDE